MGDYAEPARLITESLVMFVPNVIVAWMPALGTIVGKVTAAVSALVLAFIASRIGRLFGTTR